MLSNAKSRTAGKTTTTIITLLLLAATSALVAQENPEELDNDLLAVNKPYEYIRYEYATLYSLDQMVFSTAEKTEIIKE